MKLAACYIRVSTDDQLEYSPDSQLTAIRKYAKANDMLLPDEFVFIEQDGISGRKAEKRPEFQRMIGIAKTKPKPFDVVLVWKFSRFARNREDSIVYKSMLRKQLGIEVVSISENVGDDKMSVIFEAMIEAMDEYYSINLAEEVKRGMTEKAKRGEALSIAPLGYKIENKKLVIVPDKAEIIRSVFERYAAGATLRGIAEWLNDIGVRTKRGNMIENRTIEYWLRNPVYNGFIRWTPTGKTRRNYNNPDSIITKGSHEPIIEDELWERVQERMKGQKAKYVRYQHNSAPSVYAISGIFRCSACGCAMARSTKEYMQCTGYSHGSCKQTHSIKVNSLTAMLSSVMSDDVKNNTYHIDISDSSPLPNSDSSIVEKQLERERQKLTRAKEAYLNGIDTAEEYKSNKQSIQAEIERLTEELGKQSQIRTTDENGLVVPELYDIYRERVQNAIAALESKTLSEQDKNKTLKNTIRKAVFSKDTRTVIIFYQ